MNANNVRKENFQFLSQKKIVIRYVNFVLMNMLLIVKAVI